MDDGTDAQRAEHANVARVRAAAAELGLALDVRRFPEGTRTAQDAATAIGCPVGAIVKSLIFTVDGEVVLALVSGANQLDEARLAAAAGGSTCRRANADDVRAATGFPIGGVPPIGLATPVREFLDEDLLGHEVVWAAAGTWHDVFPIAPTDLAAASGGWVGALRRDA
ncbi:MAG: YbaK/EbsC family protein [Candidatus Nanopelagicales bacterium]|jgi:prolyl-tRNA editing enzyme YbaK/EbsC (Cys-tRNA(Pro) deacylase)|nr:YbaK/EbsC family protein [Candidatus Nanopelagicales bacterium]